MDLPVVGLTRTLAGKVRRRGVQSEKERGKEKEIQKKKKRKKQ